MKKLILFLIFCAFVAAPAAAQDKTPQKKLTPLNLRHRLSFSYGDGMCIGLGAEFNQFPGILPASHGERMTSIGSFNIDYLHMTKSGRWGFGGGLSLIPVKYLMKDPYMPAFDQLLASVAGRVQCNYFRSKLVELYGTASAGVTFSASGIGTKLCALAWQFDPIGVRVGTERIAGFVSVGYGSRGIIGVGLQVGL